MIHGSSVLLMSAFGRGSGYGADGVSLAQHLEERGAIVHLDPFSVGVPLPLDVAKMLARPRPEYFDLMLRHADPGSMVMPVHVRESHRVGTTLGWTMWEFGSVKGEEWEDSLRDRLAGFDVVLGYTRTTTAVLEPYLTGARAGTIMGGYEADLWQIDEEDPPRRDWDGRFRFGMVITNTRKNLAAAYNAFVKLKAEYGADFDAEIHFKVNDLFMPPQFEDHEGGVYIHLVGWTHQQMREFYSGLNCLICPSIGEGKSLPPMEAGTLGCPSILSACTGHVDWATDDFAYLVGGDIRERDPVRLPGQTAFFVDESKLAETMWHVYQNRGEARLKGELASRVIPQAHDWSRVIERLDYWLDEASA